MAIKMEMLRCFASVAHHGSLAGAADDLGRTPSAISMMLSQLEACVGAPLFETDRKNRLTPLGRMTLEEAERAVTTFQQSTTAIERHSRSTAGTVRIAAVPSASLTLLPAAIAEFRRERPDVRLEISDVDSASVLRRLELDAADIGLASGSIPASLEGEVIAVDPLGIICHAEGPIASCRRPVTWASLALEPLIGNGLCTLVKEPDVEMMFRACALTALNTTTLLAFVRNGLGATILPERTLLAQTGPMRFFLPEGPGFQRHLMLLYSRDRRRSPVAQAFHETLRDIASASVIA